MADQSPLLLDVLLFLLLVNRFLHLILRLLVLIHVFVGVVISPSHYGGCLALHLPIKVLAVPRAIVSFVRLSERLVGYWLHILLLV